MPPLKLIPPGSEASAGQGTPIITARFSTPGAASGDTSGGIMNFTKKLDDALEHEMAVMRMGALADGGSKLQNALDAKRIELEGDPDIAGREAKFQAFARQKYAELSDGMDRETGVLFKRTAFPLMDSINMNVRHQARKDLNEDAIVKVGDANQQLVNRIGSYGPGDPARQSVLDTVKQNIDTLMERGVITPAQRNQMIKDTLVKSDEATGLQMIQKSPSAAKSYLSNPDNLPNLDPVRRENMIAKAGSEELRQASLAAANASRAYIAEQRLRQQTADGYMKQIIDQAFSPTGVSEDLLRTARSALTYQEYEAAKVFQTGGAKVSDVATVTNIEKGMGERDMKPEILDAFGKRQITQDYAVSKLSQNESLLKDDRPPSLYNQGKQNIERALDVKGLDKDAQMIQAQGFARAMQEYYNQVDALSVEDRRKPGVLQLIAEGIIQRHSLLNFNAIGEVIGTPRFAPGDTTQENIDFERLKQAGQETNARLTQGVISREEAEREFRKIEVWEQLLAKRPAPKAKPAENK